MAQFKKHFRNKVICVFTKNNPCIEAEATKPRASWILTQMLFRLLTFKTPTILREFFFMVVFAY